MFLSLVSGSSGNCSLISDKKTVILTDCGLSMKRLSQMLDTIGISPYSISALLITHEHSDHIKGAGSLSKKYGLPVFATEETLEAIKNCGIPEENIKYISPYTDFEIGTIGVRPFSIPHDAKNPVGYSFFYDGNKLSIATDMGHMPPGILKELKGSIAVILESNHDINMLKNGPYPPYLKRRILGNNGHLSNQDAAKTALELIKSGTRHIMLGHLSRENNTPELAFFETANLAAQNGITPGRDFYLRVAAADSVTGFSAQKTEEYSK